MSDAPGAGDPAPPAPAQASKAVLVGFMGAGKSTAARAVGPGSADVDEVIERSEGHTVQEIFQRDGEAAFRGLEERVTLELLDDPELHTVALGGGAIQSQAIQRALLGTRVIWLISRSNRRGSGSVVRAERGLWRATSRGLSSCTLSAGPCMRRLRM